MSISLLAKPNRSAFLGEKITQDITLILIQFDASISERYSRAKEVTSHPVEAGADISDHTRVLPLTIDIHGWVSDDPILFLASLRAQPSVAGGNPRTRSRDAWRELNRIMDEEDEVKVVSDLDEFENMVLTNIDVNKDKDSGRILDATITLQQITVATTEITAAPVPAPTNTGDASSNRAPKSDLGKQVAKPPRNASALLRLIE